MASIDRLYDAFGELIYAVAKADGKVQDVEVNALNEILLGHPWAVNIKWSFNYEKKNQNSFEDTFKKGLITCQDYGPSEDYEFLFDVLDTVAEANQGITEKERAIIDRFKKELRTYFLEQ